MPATQIFPTSALAIARPRIILDFKAKYP